MTAIDLKWIQDRALPLIKECFHGSSDSDIQIEPLVGDGSDRSFFRVRAVASVAILLYGPDPRENLAYERIGRHLSRLFQTTPEFYAVDLDAGLFLMEDLGAKHLEDLAKSSNSSKLMEAYFYAVRLLADMHSGGLSGFDPAWCFQTKAYDYFLIREKETRYFLEAFVSGYMGLATDEAEFEDEFHLLAESALGGTETVLMHRDFQSRNLMMQGNRLRLIDFQGARLGPPGYDLASLIYDPYISLGEKLKADLIKYYLDRRNASGGVDKINFTYTLPYLAACRLMQALGAYGHLTKVKGKMHFMPYIDVAAPRLAKLFQTRAFENMPRLRGLTTLIAELIGEKK